MGHLSGATSTMTSPETSEQGHFSLHATLTGHSGWVTSIATTPEKPDMILSASRDKTVFVWQIGDRNVGAEEEEYAYPLKSLHGHGHFVQDVVISSDGQFALSGSWDGTLRLWDLNTGRTTRRFIGHEKDVLSVAFSTDNRQIVSGSRDKTIKLWNTLGECKYTIVSEGATPSGCLVCLSPLTPRTLLLCLVAGTSSSRCGTFPTASSAPTSSGTVATSTLSLSPQMAPCVPLVARMVLLCSGTLTRASACTPSHASRVTSFILSASRQTDTGCVLPPTMASASGISRARASWTSSSSTVSTCQRQTSSPRLCQCPASPSRGLLTVTLSSLVTPMA